MEHKHPKFRRIFNNPYLYALTISFVFTAFCIAACSRLSLLSSLTPVVYNSDSSIDRYYDDDSRYIRCHAKKLYYSGYDYSAHGKIKGHYYYALENDTCTLYLLSENMIKDAQNPPLTLSDVTFTATLQKNDAHLKPLLEYMSVDLGWNYAGLSKCTSSILISEYHYNAPVYILIGIITFAGIACTLILLICAFHHCKNSAPLT